MEAIVRGQADIMLGAGTEAPLVPLAFAGEPNWERLLFNSVMLADGGSVTTSATATLVAMTATNPYFRSFVNTDVIGTEYGGVLKNLVALAIGIVDGVGYGENTKASIITRGLVEMTDFAVAYGALPETMSDEEKELVFSNWPEYIDVKGKRMPTLEAFEKKSGIDVTYNTDVNDNNEFFAKVQNQLGACEPVGRDIFVRCVYALRISISLVVDADLTAVSNAGGLGIITFTTLIIVLLGRRLSLRQEAISTSSVEAAAPHLEVGLLTRDIVRFTIAIELLGAVAGLRPGTPDNLPRIGPGAVPGPVCDRSSGCAGAAGGAGQRGLRRDRRSHAQLVVHAGDAFDVADDQHHLFTGVLVGHVAADRDLADAVNGQDRHRAHGVRRRAVTANEPAKCRARNPAGAVDWRAPTAPAAAARRRCCAGMPRPPCAEGRR